MKKIFFVLGLLISLFASSQGDRMRPLYNFRGLEIADWYLPPTNYVYVNQRYRWFMGMFDSGFHVPTTTVYPTLSAGQWTGAGGLKYRTTDSSFYGYSAYQWTRIASSQSVNQALANCYGILSGGVVSWVSGLTFDVSPAQFTINCFNFSSAQSQEVATAADPTNPRIDIIVVDTLGNVSVIAGTPAASPLKPQADPSYQIELTFFTVAAGATTPSGVSSTVVYDENNTWTTSQVDWTPSVAADFNATTAPFNGTKHIAISNTGTPTSASQLLFVNGSVLNVNDYTVLKFYIRLVSGFSIASQGISLRLANGTTFITNPLPVQSGNYGFSRIVSGSYQIITIPMSAFTYTGTSPNQFDRLYIYPISGAKNFYLDYIQLQAGISAPPSSGSSGTRLDQILPATATNTINNAALLQEWQWNTLAGSGLKLSSTSTAAAGGLQKLFEVSLSGVNATSSQTTYGIYSVNTHTGTSSTNYGVFGQATGGTTNYGVGGLTTTASGYGVRGLATVNTAGTGTGVLGLSSGVSTTNVGGEFSAQNATNNYAIIVGSGNGNVGFGTSAPSVKSILDLTSTTQGFLTPRMTQAQRDAITSVPTGLLIYQTDGTAGFYYYDGAAWTAIGGGGGGSGTVNAGAALKAAYYPTAATTVDDWIGVEFGNTNLNTKIDIQATTEVGLEIKAEASQTANLLDFSSSSGTGDLAKVEASGKATFNGITIGSASSVPALWFTLDNTASTATAVLIRDNINNLVTVNANANNLGFRVGNNSTNMVNITANGKTGFGVAYNYAATAQVDIAPVTAATVGQIIKLATTPTANAFEVNSNSGSGGDLLEISSTGWLGVGGDAGLPIHGHTDNAFNTSVSKVLGIRHTTSGVPGAGIGVGQSFEVETAAGNIEEGATIHVTAQDVTAAAEDFGFEIRTMTEGSPDRGKYNILGKRTTLTESSATTFVRVNVPSGSVSGGEILVTVRANDATDFQARTLRFIWSAVNKAGTTTVTISTPEELVAVSTGTLTATITAVDATGGNVDFKINAVSSLTQTVLNATGHVWKNHGTGAISPM